MTSQLGLGTAQFGLDYGIANTAGCVPEHEVERILDLARENAICVLDTAPAYGKAESVLGRLVRTDDRFRIVTKTISIASPRVGGTEIAAVEAAFVASLARMKAERVAGLLVHQAGDLLKPGGERLWALMRSWQEAGKVGKLGASVYDRQQIDALVTRYPLELLQLPLNVFDQRLIRDGTLAALAAGGIEIHARSVFLQGLLLMNEDELPSFAAPWRARLRAFHADAARIGSSALSAALTFVCQRPEIATVLIGVASVEQLRQCLSAANASIMLDWARYAIDDPDLVDPRRWPTRQ